jgi:hypothetical protein
VFLEHLQEFAKSTWHPSIIGKTEKIVLQQFGILNFSNLANLPPPRAYLRAERERASGFTCKFKRDSSFLSGALRFLTGLFVRLADLFLFYQVQMTNSWKESIFSLVIYFTELPNHDICQVNFDKLLEMLTVLIHIAFIAGCTFFAFIIPRGYQKSKV